MWCSFFIKSGWTSSSIIAELPSTSKRTLRIFSWVIVQVLSAVPWDCWWGWGFLGTDILYTEAKDLAMTSGMYAWSSISIPDGNLSGPRDGQPTFF